MDATESGEPLDDLLGLGARITGGQQGGKCVERHVPTRHCHPHGSRGVLAGQLELQDSPDVVCMEAQ
ncbi:Uncharacterised protein [Mycobacteroides abscessus subsp. abscessus]|nr:Uncharacterised protein [Mycobacteroides abscessus subsp. abscessus]